MHYTVIFRLRDDPLKFEAECPAFHRQDYRCAATGRTVEEATQNIQKEMEKQLKILLQIVKPPPDDVSIQLRQVAIKLPGTGYSLTYLTPKRTANDLLDQEYLIDVILLVLADLEGSASISAVIDRVGYYLRYYEILQPQDEEPSAEEKAWPSWEVGTRYARKKAVDNKRWLVEDSQRGTWQLTPTGWDQARRLGSAS